MEILERKFATWMTLDMDRFGRKYPQGGAIYISTTGTCNIDGTTFLSNTAASVSPAL